MRATTSVPFGGFVDDAFAGVGETFRTNFKPRDDRVNDLGAALTVIVAGRAIAEFYSALLPGAAVPLLGPEILREATSTQSQGPDLVLGRDSWFGLGVGLHQKIRYVGLTPSAFGHYGHGGSLGFADPDARVACGYLESRTGQRWQDPRTKALLAALRTCR